MSCKNLEWGVWIPGNKRGKKIIKQNIHPENKRSKLWIKGEWSCEKDKWGHKKLECRNWTQKEIEEGWGYTKTYGKLRLIPIKCENCDHCRLRKANEWVTRLMCEWKTSNQQGCKIDLTYAPKYVPEGYKLSKTDVPGFIKRLKSQIRRNEGQKASEFKYYYGGEYGPEGGRPHYHIIIIGWTPKDQIYWKDSKTGYPMYTSEIISEKWGMGICTIQGITSETISYATRYTNKKSINAKSNSGIEEFQRQSKNIGAKYWETNNSIIKEDLGIWIKGSEKAKLVPIPRYYKKKWKKENPIQYELYNEFVEWQEIKKEEYRKQHSNLSKIEYIHNQSETASIIIKQLKRSNLETQHERLDIANINGYNHHVANG